MVAMDRLLGERLRMLREEKGWTQIQAAKLLGITNASLSNYERNERTPDVDMLKAFAEIYDVSIDYLIGYKPSKKAISIRESDQLENTIGLQCALILKKMEQLYEEEEELLFTFLQGLEARRKLYKRNGK
jgi:transcriptional regulator with XRE-family HTH domain